MSSRGSSLRQLEARHPSMSWRALVRTERAITGSSSWRRFAAAWGVDTSPPAGCCRETVVAIRQLVSSQWFTGGRFSWSIQSFPGATRLFPEGYGRRHVDVARREEGSWRQAWATSGPGEPCAGSSTRSSCGATARNTDFAHRPSPLDWSTVLGRVKGALAPLGGCAALDAACAPCGEGNCDGRRFHTPVIAERARRATWRPRGILDAALR